MSGDDLVFNSSIDVALTLAKGMIAIKETVERYVREHTVMEYHYPQMKIKVSLAPKE